jgi:asparagine synthase (glutamine-hydrolysing)
MMNRIAHRGPDGNGSRIFSNAALGHTRLAIIDLTSGDQPMNSHDGRFCIIFNGEIYNYESLRSQLESKGHTFKSASDTEVIMEVYRAWGWQGFSRLRGMYAFAIWDQEHSTGVLARDPLGIKPLFIRKQANGEISFASEAKAILARRDVESKLNCGSLHLLMNFRYVPGNGSLFEGIEQLPAGGVKEWKAGGGLTDRKIPNPETDLGGASVLETLRDSVGAHFTADVEVGAYLSGGLDSAAVVALGKDLSPAPLRTFTLDVGDDPNEAKNAARTAALLGVENLQDHVECDLQDILPRLIWHLELPKINALQVSLLAKLTAAQVKVTLSGLGGDELFLGYNAHRIFFRAEQMHRATPSWLSGPLGGIGAKLMSVLQKQPWSESERALHMFHSLGNWPRVYGLLRNVWDNPELRSRIYGPRMLDCRLPDAYQTIENLWPESTHPVEAMASFEWQQKMVNDLLWQEDRVSMAEGLEVRVPFVDQVLAGKVGTLNLEDLMPGGKPKAYLRKTLAEVLPNEIFNRPKSGFQVDAASFFNQHLSDIADRLLSEDKIVEYGLFNPDFVREVRQYPDSKRFRWHYFLLYMMLMTHLWIDTFETDQWQHQS